MQGKPALTLLHSEVDSPYFPIVEDEAFTILQSSPIARGKENLIKEFVRGALSSCIKEELTDRKLRQRVAAFRAVQRLHPETVSSDLTRWFPSFLRRAKDAEYSRLLNLLEQAPELEERIDEASSITLRQYIENLPIPEEPKAIVALSLISSLQDAFTEKISRLSSSEDSISRLKSICDSFQATGRAIPPTILEEITSKYELANNYDTANYLASGIISKAANNFSKDQSRRIIGAFKNDQVRGSFEFNTALNAIKTAEILNPDEFDQAIESTSRSPALLSHMNVPPWPPLPQSSSSA